MSTSPALGFAMIYVSDLDAALAYCTTKLGLVRDADQSGPTFHFLLSGSGGMPLGLGQAVADGPKAGTIELAFKTPNADAFHSELADKGLDLSPVETRPFGRTFTAQAFDGVSFDVWSDPAHA